MRATTASEKNLSECLGLCLDCHKACIETMLHCHSLGGQHAGRQHQNLLHDCSDICTAASSFLARHSPNHVATCRVCAEICEACAEDCERLGPDDEPMKRCAEVCRRCAASCRAMSGG